MAKQEAEWSNTLRIFWLKQNGYLNYNYSYQSGGIRWTYGLSGNESSIGFSIEKDDWGTPLEVVYVRLKYTHTNRFTAEKEDMDYKIRLQTTPCNYGGKRYWFICSLSKNGIYCGKRVGVLFSNGKWFGCRHCGNITYAAQLRGGKYRGSSVTYPDIDKLAAQIKRRYYQGKPTRKYRRFLKMEEKLTRDMMVFSSRLAKSNNKNAEKKKK